MMSEKLITIPASVLAEKQKMSSDFIKKGATSGLVAGMFYGLYSTFLLYATQQGIWAEWYGPNIAGLSTFVIVYVLGALGSATNDTCSAIWTIIIAAGKGKLGDFFRCIKTKPGMVIMFSAIIGGPIASTAYVVALQMAGSIVIPITTIYPAIGAILARILFKQKLNVRMLFGIALCITAAIMIGSTSMGSDAPEGRLLGMLIALIGAFGWAIEGCIAGYGTTVVDYEIGIAIRQSTSGLTNLIILVPLMCALSGDIGISKEVIGGAFTSWPAMKIFLISGFFSVFAYSLWYKGNSMCGAALGMAANSMYCFWGPLFCWIILGGIFGQEGWTLPPIAWVAAVVMFIGILFVAMNPLDLLSKKGVE